VTPALHPVLQEDFSRLLSADLPWHRLAGRTVLITGAAGLVASYLVEALLYRNEATPGDPCTVVALVRDRARAAERFARHRDRDDLRLLVQDVVDPVPAHVRADYVVHAAGNATPRRFGADPVGTYAAATLGTHRLLEHAHRTGCEGFLLLSTGAVQGTVPGDDVTLDERIVGVADPLDPYACYAESRRMAETMCASWTRQFGLRTRIARLGHTYGPGLRRDDDRAFAQFVWSAIDGRDIVLNSDGSAVRYYCYLADATDALLRVLLTGADGEAYLLANADSPCSVKHLATLVASLAPGGPVRVRRADAPAGSVPNRDPTHRLDVSKLRALGWSPSVSVGEGFARTVRSLL
jgi:UDP-glucuronate decarboxylase